MKRHLYPGLLADRKRTIQEIFKIIPDFLFRIDAPMTQFPFFYLRHVYNSTDRATRILSDTFVRTNCTVWLPCQRTDWNFALPHHGSKAVISINLLISAIQSQMDDRVFEYRKTSRIRDFQIKFRHALLQTGYALIIPVVFMKHHGDVLHAHLPVKLQFRIAGCGPHRHLYLHHMKNPPHFSK